MQSAPVTNEGFFFYSMKERKNLYKMFKIELCYTMILPEKYIYFSVSIICHLSGNFNPSAFNTP